MAHYSILVTPAEHKPANNLLLALVHGDTLGSNQFSKPANADGSYNDPDDLDELATHFYMGQPVTDEWLLTVANLASNLPEPPGGWPYEGITEQDAVDAAGTLHLQTTTTQPPAPPPSPHATLANALTALNIVKIEIIEEE